MNRAPCAAVQSSLAFGNPTPSPACISRSSSEHPPRSVTRISFSSSSARASHLHRSCSKRATRPGRRTTVGGTGSNLSRAVARRDCARRSRRRRRRRSEGRRQLASGRRARELELPLLARAGRPRTSERARGRRQRERRRRSHGGDRGRSSLASIRPRWDARTSAVASIVPPCSRRKSSRRECSARVGRRWPLHAL